MRRLLDEGLKTLLTVLSFFFILAGRKLYCIKNTLQFCTNTRRIEDVTCVGVVVL
jgi:hypothetical protein